MTNEELTEKLTGMLKFANEEHDVPQGFLILYDNTYGYYGYKDDSGIHWYQLCLTELPNRIWNKLLDDAKDVALTNFLCDGKEHLQNIHIAYDEECLRGLQNHVLHYKHPVNFLYNFVKKCKKNKYFK